MAKALFFNVMREAAGTAEAQIGEECTTVAQAVESLLVRFPALGEKILDESGKAPRAGVSILLDGRKVRSGEFETTRLRPKSELSFFAIVGGG